MLMLVFYMHTFLLVQFACKVHHYQTVLVAANFLFLADLPLFEAEFAAVSDCSGYAVSRKWLIGPVKANK